MTLYQLAHSPYCIPIRLMLEAAAFPHETVEVPNHDRSLVLRLTEGAYYGVPVVEHKGRVVWESGPDSQDVARFVDEVACGGHLFPAHLFGQQAVFLPYLENEVEAATFKLCDIHYVPSIADPVARGMVIRHKERKFGTGCLATWEAQREALWEEAVAKLRPFDQMLAHSPFVWGSSPDYTDFLLAGILGNLTYNGWNPFPPLPHLHAWHERLSAYRF